MLVEHPFLDPRLICFLLGLHARVAPQPRSRPKPILVEAMRGILPDSIRLRHKGGFFNEPYFRGLAQHLSKLEKLFFSGQAVTPDWLDSHALLHCLRQSALGIGNDRIQLDRLNITLSWLRWLALPRTQATLQNDESSVHLCGYRQTASDERRGLESGATAG